MIKADTTEPQSKGSDVLRSPCLCAAIRKAGRILTRRYDQYLKPSGLKITQFSLLANISRNPGVTISDLAKLLLMDQTTVTRNLRVLERLGFIHLKPATTDQRIKRVTVADVGISKLDEARPLWEKVQREMDRKLGRENTEELLETLSKLAG